MSTDHSAIGRVNRYLGLPDRGVSVLIGIGSRRPGNPRWLSRSSGAIVPLDCRDNTILTAGSAARDVTLLEGRNGGLLARVLVGFNKSLVYS